MWGGLEEEEGFFFQAEDGIRGLVRSRGLGDVYKGREVVGAAVVGAAVGTSVGMEVVGSVVVGAVVGTSVGMEEVRSLIHILRRRRIEKCSTRWSTHSLQIKT